MSEVGPLSGIKGFNPQDITGLKDEATTPEPKLANVKNSGQTSKTPKGTYVKGVNTAGTVRVNNLANLEALLNIMANGIEVLGICWGGPSTTRRSWPWAAAKIRRRWDE